MLAIILLASMFFYKNAEAYQTTLFSQTVNTEQSNSTANQFQVKFAPGSFPTSIEAVSAMVGGSSNTWKLTYLISDTATSGRTAIYTDIATATTTTSGKQSITFNHTATPVVANQAKWLWISLDPSGVGGNSVYGSPSEINSFYDVACGSSACTFPSNTTWNDVREMYIILWGDSSQVNTGLSTITPVYPQNNDTTAGTVVEFEWNYFVDNADTDLTITGLEVIDYVTLQTVATPEAGVAPGSGTARFNVELTSNHQHFYKVYLRNEEDSRRITGGQYWFDVVGTSTPLEQFSYIDPITGNPVVGTSTGLWDFVNVPVLLKTRAPTAYIYQIADVIQQIQNIEATTTPTLTMSFVSASSSITALKNVEIFSYDIVTDLIPSNMITILRALMVATLYIGLAFGILHHSHNMFS